MKINLEFERKENRLNSETDNDDLFPTILLDCLYSNSVVGGVYMDGQLVKNNYKRINIADIALDYANERKKNEEFDYKKRENGQKQYMQKFRDLHVKLGIPKDFHSKYLLEDGNLCATEEDREFLYNYFRHSSPSDAQHKIYRDGKMKPEYAENLIWLAEGLYRIYYHMGVSREVLEELSRYIIKKTGFTYWKEYLVYMKLRDRLKENMENIIEDTEKSDREKHVILQKMETDILEVLKKY